MSAGRPLVYQRACAARCVLLLDGGAVDSDGDLFRDQHTAGGQGGVEVDAEVLAVDGGGGFKPEAGVAVGVFGGAAEFNVKDDFLGYALDGQGAGDGAFGARGEVDVRAGGDKSDLRVVTFDDEDLRKR